MVKARGVVKEGKWPPAPSPTGNAASAAEPWLPSPLPSSPHHPFALLLWLLPLAWIFRVTVLAERKGDIAQVGGYQLLQIAIIAVTVLVVIASARGPQMWQLCRGRPAVLLVYYYLLCLLTAAISVFPQYSAYRSVEFTAMMLAIFIALSYRRNFYDAEKTVLILIVPILILNLIHRGHLNGFSLSLLSWHSNDFPATGAMLFCYCVGEYFGDPRGRRLRLLFGAALGGAFMVLGTSAGSFAAAFFGLLVIAYFRRNIALFLAAGFGGIMLALIAATGAFESVDVVNVITRGKGEQHLETASGRLPIWEFYFEQHVLKKPLIGHGLGSLSDEMSGGLVKTQPHASFMSVLLYTGAVGAVFYLGFVFRCLKDGFWACGRRLPGAVGCVAAIAAGFVNSQTNPFIFDLFEVTSAVFCAFLALFTLFVVVPARRAAAPAVSPPPLLPKGHVHAHHLRRPRLP